MRAEATGRDVGGAVRKDPKGGSASGGGDATTRPPKPPKETRQKGEAIAKTLYRQHSTTDAYPTGLGGAMALLPGRSATEQLWEFQAPPKWLPPVARTKFPSGGASAAHAVELELARSKAVARLRSRLQELCDSAGVRVVPKLAFEKWRFCAKWQEDNLSEGGSGGHENGSKKAKNKEHSDPLLPTGRFVKEPGLIADLQRAGATSEAAEAVTVALASECGAAVLEVSSLAHKLKSGRPPMAAAELPTLTGHKHSLDLACKGQFVKLSRNAFEKLQLLYTDHAPTADGDHNHFEPPQAGQVAPACAFVNRLFVLLLRYKTIQGHGFQAAAGPEVFRLLAKEMRVALECFASPLNTYFGRYCSAFPDVDGPFGSQGSFSQFSPASGSFQANPPFVPYIMNAMAERICNMLDNADEKSAPLSFVIFIPGWEECESWERIKGSSFLRGQLLLAADDHGYCDGASHQRKDSFRASCYDTGIFFLQTARASRKWPVTDALLNNLKRAMAMAMPSEAAAKRQKRSR